MKIYSISIDNPTALGGWGRAIRFPTRPPIASTASFSNARVGIRCRTCDGVEGWIFVFGFIIGERKNGDTIRTSPRPPNTIASAVKRRRDSPGHKAGRFHVSTGQLLFVDSAKKNFDWNIALLVSAFRKKSIGVSSLRRV